MNYREFIAAVRKELMKRLPDGVSVHVLNVSKNNGVTMKALAVRRGEENLCPMISLEPCYQMAVSGRPLDGIVDEIISLASLRPSRAVSSRIFFDFTEASERIAYRLVSTAANADLLKQVPHREFLDFSLIYYLSIAFDGSRRGSCVICNQHLKGWGVTESQLYRAAASNTPKMLPPVSIPIEKVLSSAIIGSEQKTDAAAGLTVLTNRDNLYGDAVVLYPGFLRNTARLFGCDLFLLPSSIHEFLALPVTAGISGVECRRIVISVNRTAVEEEDVLSDHVYRYVRDLDRMVTDQ